MAQVHVITTHDTGSMDRYGRDLAARLPVPEVRLQTDNASIETYGIPLLSRAAFTSFRRDLRLIAALHRVPGVLHVTHHHMARYGPFTRRPYILTVHDIIRWLDLTRTADVLISRPTARDAMMLRLDYRAFRCAVGIIAVSEATKRDLIQHLGIAADRIRVVHEAIDLERFRPCGDRPVPEPYVLYVGSEHPRKNLAVLFRAFAELKREGLVPGVRLVKVGLPGSAESPFRDRTLQLVAELGLQDDVIFTGHVADEELPAYYTHATCLVLPSRYEGFGLPPIEAMACGCPVVVSTAGSLPEVVGDAGLTFDPVDHRQLTESLFRVLTTQRLREEMRDRGTRRVRHFTWERVVTETLDVYRDALSRLDRTSRRRLPQKPTMPRASRG